MRRRWITLAAVAAIALTLHFVPKTIAKAAEPDLSQVSFNALINIGVEDGTIPGFYKWATATIFEFMDMTDKALENALGTNAGMADAFKTYAEQIYDAVDNLPEVEEEPEVTLGTHDAREDVVDDED